MKYRYFARVNGNIVQDVYMAEPDDPICDKMLAEGLIESIVDGKSPGEEWYKQREQLGK